MKTKLSALHENAAPHHNLNSEARLNDLARKSSYWYGKSLLNINKGKYLIGIAAAGTTAGLLLTPVQTRAFWPFDLFNKDESETQATTAKYPPMIQFFIDKFGLKEAEVDTALVEFRQQQQTQMKANLASRLDQLVADGKFTAAQKEALLAKMTEWQAQRESWKDLTPEERQTKAQAHRTEMKQWAKDNGIDLSLIGPFGKGFGMGFERGFGRGMHMGYKIGNNN